jgi:3'-phosphoadenosine 5'-phosphosulfate (PAPS) 3'-phosphatase
MPDLSELLDFAHSLAWEAGKLALRYYQTDFVTERKADESPVTIADRETEKFLRAAINAR